MASCDWQKLALSHHVFWNHEPRRQCSSAHGSERTARLRLWQEMAVQWEAAATPKEQAQDCCCCWSKWQMREAPEPEDLCHDLCCEAVRRSRLLQCGKPWCCLYSSCWPANLEGVQAKYFREGLSNAYVGETRISPAIGTININPQGSTRNCWHVGMI